MIDDHMLTLAAAGRPPTTMALRRIQLVRLARDLGGHPADVTGEQLVEWFGSQTGWTTETRRSYRSGVHEFFRWAYRTKRVPEQLADELPKVREHRGRPRPAPDRVWRETLMAATPRVALMLRLSAEAGLRRGEVACAYPRPDRRHGRRPAASPR
jgi:integrase